METVIRQLADDEYDEATQLKAKQSQLTSMHAQPHGVLSQREAIWGRLVIDLLASITGEDTTLDVLRATSVELAASLAVPLQTGSEDSHILTQLAHTSRAFEWANNEIQALGTSPAAALFTSNNRLIRSAEKSCITCLKQTHIGSHLGGAY